MELERVLRYAAFPDGPGGGNPAGVVLEADDLDDAARQEIAAAVGYSETAFVDRPDSAGIYRMRYFSPQAEVGFCGHATVAAGVALAERGAAGELVFATKAGRVDVETDSGGGRPTATLTSVPTHTRPADDDEVEELLDALRWKPDDLDARFPVHVAFAGNDHPVLAVKERAVLAHLDYDYPALAELMAERKWTTVHLVWAAGPAIFHARDPFPPGGVVEDPATGAAAAAFGGYLRDLGLVELPARITLLQGADMGRPSRLVVDVRPDDRRVRVTGTATPIE
jgi:PhzF family phenazine biosynthesis protein